MEDAFERAEDLSLSLSPFPPLSISDSLLRVLKRRHMHDAPVVVAPDKVGVMLLYIMLMLLCLPPSRESWRPEEFDIDLLNLLSVPLSVSI